MREHKQDAAFRAHPGTAEIRPGKIYFWTDNAAQIPGPEAWEAIILWNAAQRGILPHAGGWQDQPEITRLAITILDAMQAGHERAEHEKRQAEINAMKAKVPKR